MIRLETKETKISKISNLKTRLSVSRMYGAIMTLVCCFFAFGYMKSNNDFVSSMNDQKVEYESQILTLNNDHNDYVDQTEYIYNQLTSMSETITELTDISTKLDEENQQLKQDNLDLMDTVDEYQSREELFNKYEYALYDTQNKRTDITYNQLSNLETMLEDSNIKDTDLILAMIMTESNGNEKAQSAVSTAKGYGQILDGTSKFVYTKLLNNSGWNSSVALNGDTNIEMMVAYTDYLYDQNNGNLYEIIKDYRGKTDITSYVRTIDTYLASADKSVQLVAQEIKATN